MLGPLGGGAAGAGVDDGAPKGFLLVEGGVDDGRANGLEEEEVGADCCDCCWKPVLWAERNEFDE